MATPAPRTCGQALEDESGLPVTSIMDSWVKQMGYPGAPSPGRPPGRGRADLTLFQERFVYDRLLGDEDPNPEVWQVPVSISGPGAATASDGDGR